ncbi:MAG: archaeosortase/exosortase family protein [Puniceicoccales bacterium]|jgi:exosortase/archaeosortase family protein|nr:archaeosortase/exosortase family protein [Puniceicoccales bacterium]
MPTAVITPLIWRKFVVSGGAVVIAKLAIATLPDAAFAQIFCRVPAWIAAAYFQASLTGETLCLASGRMVSVTRACGGADFFAILCAMFAWQVVPGRIRWFPVLCAGAWVVTIFVNAMRVIAAVWIRAFTELLLPERMEAAVHLVSGVLVFFPALLAIWWLSCRAFPGKCAIIEE